MESVNTMTLDAEKRTNVRYWIVVMLFIVTAFNYGDRATLSIAGASTRIQVRSATLSNLSG